MNPILNEIANLIAGLIVSPPVDLIAGLTLLAPLLLSAIALALAIWTGATMLKTADSLAGGIRSLAARGETLQQSVDALPPVPVRSRPGESAMAQPVSDGSGAAQAGRPNQAPDARPVLSPEAAALKEKREAVRRSMDTFETALRLCAASARLSVAELASGAWPPAGLADRLDLAKSAQEVHELYQLLRPLAVETARVVLSKCDHDVDPRRADTRLQSAIDSLMKLIGLDLYLPEPGDPVDRTRHRSVGIEPHPREDLRGTVASVRARGLIMVAPSHEEIVIAPAEIRVYD